MTALTFKQTYGPLANAISHGTGIDSDVLLAQWGVETAWGNSIYNACNLANIRCLSGVPCDRGFAQFPSFSSFIANCVATWHNGYYADVLAQTTPAAQLLAIGRSPWDAGHYDNGGGAGSSLIAAYKEVHLSDFTDGDRKVLQSIHDRLSSAVPGTLDDQIKAAVTAALIGATIPSTIELTGPELTEISDAVVAAIKTIKFGAV